MVILKVGIGLFSERLFLVCFDFFSFIDFFFSSMLPRFLTVLLLLSHKTLHNS